MLAHEEEQRRLALPQLTATAPFFMLLVYPSFRMPGSFFRTLRQLGAAIRVRATCLDQRPKLSRAWQRARSDYRQPGWHFRRNHSEAPRSQENHKPAGIQNRHRRRLFLPAGGEGAPLSVSAERWNVKVNEHAFRQCGVFERNRGR